MKTIRGRIERFSPKSTMSPAAAGESDIRLDAAASLMLLSSRRKGISSVPFRSVATIPTFLHNGYETLGSIICAAFTSGKKDIVTFTNFVCTLAMNVPKERS